MDFLEIFSDRVKQLMTEKDIKEKELTNETGVELSCLYAYLRQASFPSLESAIKLASFFKCSLDYLFGFTDDFEKREFILSDSIASRFETVLKEERISRYRLSKELSVSQSTLSLWHSGKIQPKLESLIRVCNKLGVSLDFLAGREE